MCLVVTLQESELFRLRFADLLKSADDKVSCTHTHTHARTQTDACVVNPHQRAHRQLHALTHRSESEKTLGQRVLQQSAQCAGVLNGAYATCCPVLQAQFLSRSKLSYTPVGSAERDELRDQLKSVSEG